MSAFQPSPRERETGVPHQTADPSTLPSTSGTRPPAHPMSPSLINVPPPHQNRIEPTLAPLMAAPHIFGAVDLGSRVCGYVATSLLICFPIGIHYGCYLRQNCTSTFYNYSTAGLTGAIISSVIMLIWIIFVFWSYYRVTRTPPGPTPAFLRTTYFEETVKRAVVLYCREKEYKILSDLHRNVDAGRNENFNSPTGNETFSSPFPKPLSLFQFNPAAPCIHLHDLSLKSERRINWEDPFSDVYRKVINPQFYDLQNRQQEIQLMAPSPTRPAPITATQLLQAAYVSPESREPTHYYSFDIKNTSMLNIVGTQSCHKCTEFYSSNASRLVPLDKASQERQGYRNNRMTHDQGRVPLVGARERAEDDDSNPQQSAYQYDPSGTQIVTSVSSPTSDSGPPQAGPVVKWGEIHHCSSCHQCVLALDHHCPWIGQCVGRSNHKFFIQFLFYTSIAALISMVSMAKDIFTGDGNISVGLGTSDRANSKVNACTWLMMVAFVIDGLFFLMLFPFFWSSLENAMTGDTKLEQMIRRRNEAAKRVRDAMQEGAMMATNGHPTRDSDGDVHPGSNRTVFDTEEEYLKLVKASYPNILNAKVVPTSAASNHATVIQIDNTDEEQYFDADDPDYVVGSWRYNLSTIFGPSRMQPLGRLSWFLPTIPVLDQRREYLLWRAGLSASVVARLSSK